MLSDIEHFELLRHPELSNIIEHGIENIETCPRLNVSHCHWQFVLHTTPQLSIMLKSLGCSVSNGMLYEIEFRDSLFSLNCIIDHGVTEVEQKKEHGFCVMIDKKRGKPTRAVLYLEN